MHHKKTLVLMKSNWFFKQDNRVNGMVIPLPVWMQYETEDLTEKLNETGGVESIVESTILYD